MARRPGLGRGLDAILPSDPVGAPGPVPTPGASGGSGIVEETGGAGAAAPDGSVGGVRELPVVTIRPNPFQPRQHFDEAELAELAGSIATVGLLQPVLVRPVEGGYELVAGERRWRACQIAGLQHIPALIRVTDDQEALAHAVVENVQRSQLSAIEEAAAYQQLISDFTLTQDQVAERVGRSRSSVANTLRLLQLSPEIQRLVLDGAISAGHARALLGTDDTTFRQQLAERIVARGLSVRQVEAAVRRHVPTEETSVGPPLAPGSTRPAALLELEQLLADRLATRVRVDLGKKRGRIEIEFADLEDLERIFRLIS